MNDLKELRERLGYTQAELCKITGANPRTLERWEYNNCAPAYFINFVAALLGWRDETLADLVSGLEE